MNGALAESLRLIVHLTLILLAVPASGAQRGSVREMLRQGNGLYGNGRYGEAINRYNDALVEQPQALEPKFNKANGYFRLDDLGEAVDLYQEVAARSKDMQLVAKAKYNLGNCFFQRGAKQRDSDLQKAVDDMKTSITYWRQVLEIDPKNEKAARNIEVARLTIKDILDQLKKQQQDQQNQQDPNQPQPQGQQQKQDQSQPQPDPNQPPDPNQTQPQAGDQDPNQPQDRQESEPQSQEQESRQPQQVAPDATAQEIIDDEQRQKKEREISKGEPYNRSRKTGDEDLLTTIVLALLLAPSAMAAGGDRVRVYAKVNAETSIYPGDDFTYSIVVEGAGKPSRVDLSPLASFNPRPAGSGTSMQTINDRTTVSYSQNYAIAAGPAGTMTLPAVTVVVDGRTYTTNPVEVTISQPGTTDRLSVELALSESQCYVGQPVVMTVTWTVTARVQEASFSVPVFRSDDFYIEDLSESEGAYAREKASIDGVPVVVSENRQLIRGMEAAILSFRKVLIPRRAGRIRLDPITVSTNMAVGRVRTNDFFNPYQIKFERVSVQSNGAELEVLPLPQEGRPAEFYGLVGRYTIEAAAAPTKVSVGDPITLTVRIGGNPYLKPVQWPQLEQVADLATGFKIHRRRPRRSWKLGPGLHADDSGNSDAVTQVRRFEAYFAPSQGRYVVAGPRRSR